MQQPSFEIRAVHRDADLDCRFLRMTQVNVTAAVMVNDEAAPLESLNHLPRLEGWQAHLGGNSHL